MGGGGGGGGGMRIIKAVRNRGNLKAAADDYYIYYLQFIVDSKIGGNEPKMIKKSPNQKPAEKVTFQLPKVRKKSRKL